MRSVATNGTDIICVGLDTVIKFDIEGRYSINQLLIDFGNAPKLE
jgi:hypothetical protein